MRIISTFLTIILWCSSTDLTSTETQQPNSGKRENDQNFINSDDFKFQNLDKFDLYNWYYAVRQEKLKKLTREEIKKYFQDTELKGDPTYNEDNWYYFSIQSNTQDKKQITIIEEYDQCCADLLLLTYDKDNNLISKNVVAGNGGDGEWFYNEFGEFETDSTYILTSVNKEQIGEFPGDEIYQIDSVITKFSVDDNLRFKKIDEKIFQYKNE